MPKNEGGFIRSSEAGESKVCAAVNYVIVTATNVPNVGQWKVYLRAVPDYRNFRRGERLVYNAKGTSNQNSDNDLVVTSVQGPGYYICSGPYPGQI